MPSHSLRRLPTLVLLLVPWAWGCGGGGGGGPGVAAPADLAYAAPSAVYATQSAIAPNTPAWTEGTPASFTVAPALPEGLSLDTTTGTISGTTTRRMAVPTVHTVTASNAGGATTAEVEITVGVLETLAASFAAEVFADGLLKPAKFAVAPDGRVFFNELGTGKTRVLASDGTLRATPFAETDVLSNGHQGLLGIVLHPDFASNGWVYVMACVAGSGMTNDRVRIMRYTEVDGMDAGTNATVIADDLPIATINDGGDLVFGIESPDPRLYASLGDTEEPSLAQTDGARAGRILRYAADGSIPGDNPVASDPEWCRGLRNTFGIDIQPTTGALFGADNGPNAGDELNYLNKGKNFEWGGLPPMFPPGDVGIIIREWLDVIVPTGLAWHDGAGWGSAYANDLFLSSYDDEAIRRFVLSGSSFLDLDEEIVFATFRPDGIDNKPLDVEVGPDGSLWVSTFTGIYRIFRP